MKYPKKISGSTTIILIKMLLGKLHAKLKSLKEKKISPYRWILLYY